MDQKFITRNLAFWPVQFANPYWPAAVNYQQRPANQIPEGKIVQALRDAFYSSIKEMKAIKEENKSLQDKIVLLEDVHQKEVSRPQEELKQKDELLQRCQRKRMARTRAHMDALCDLAKKEFEMKRMEEHWSNTCKSIEATLKEEMGDRDEEWRRKVDELLNEKNLFCKKLMKQEEEWKEAAKRIELVNNQLQEFASNTKQQEQRLEMNTQKEKLENKEAEEEETDEQRKDNKKQEGKEEKKKMEKESEENTENTESKDDEKVKESTERTEDKMTTEKKKRRHKKRGVKKKNRG